MKAFAARVWAGRWLEPVLAVAIICGLLRCGLYLWDNGYLPPPFFYVPDDTFADWFNTAFWARDPGTYDVWYTVYPPLSFVILRMIGIDSCYPDRRSYDFSAGLAARDCDWVGLAAIWIILAINIWLAWRVFSRRDRATALPRTICVGLGLPMMDAVERGNLVLLSFTFLLLGLAPLLRSARWRWVCVGAAVNLKVYLIAAVAPLVLKRKWRWSEAALLSIAIVYLVSLALLGRGTPAEIIANIRELASQPADQIMNQWYTTTYQPLLSLIREGLFPLNLVIGSRPVDLLGMILPAIQHLAQGAVLLALLGVALRPEAVPAYRVVNLGLLLALITSEAGGYSMMYFTLFCLLEPWRGWERKWSIAVCYILALPLDIIVNPALSMPASTYFGNRATIITYYVTVGPFLRPLLILSIATALSVLTVRTVAADIRHNGLPQRWRFGRLAALRSPDPSPQG